MLVTELKPQGNLCQFLQKYFSTLKWNEDKLKLLAEISSGLKIIHQVGLVHHDFHTGNILIGDYDKACLADLGLSRPADNKQSESGIFGVLPFVDPVVLRGHAYTTASDIYSFGMIMWVLTSGENPFTDREYDCTLTISLCNGERPPIIKGTPECYVNLMKRCWDSDPLKRPSAVELDKIFRDWYFGKFFEQFTRADKNNNESFIHNKVIKESQSIHSKFISYKSIEE
jgi:serine/threonine protein kinase